MSLPVVTGAVLMCPFGLSPGTLNVVPTSAALMENRPPATIMDNVPFVNVMPFGLCTSLANPITAAQTTAALGVLTPGTSPTPSSKPRPGLSRPRPVVG